MRYKFHSIHVHKNIDDFWHSNYQKNRPKRTNVTNIFASLSTHTCVKKKRHETRDIVISNGEIPIHNYREKKNINLNKYICGNGHRML